jgi:hypothetical protein
MIISSQNLGKSGSGVATNVVVGFVRACFVTWLDWSQHQIEGSMMTSENKKCTNQVWFLEVLSSSFKMS